MDDNKIKNYEPHHRIRSALGDMKEVCKNLKELLPSSVNYEK